MNTECIFCQIVTGTAPSHVVWQDASHVAFLSIFPNTEGVTVVIPKKHYTSYVFDLPEDVMQELIAAAKTVAKLLDAALPEVSRTAMVAEGFGVDHVHIKLFPLHGTMMPEWKPLHSTINTYYTEYPGYVSSHDADRADDAELAALAELIRKKNTPAD